MPENGDGAKFIGLKQEDDVECKTWLVRWGYEDVLRLIDEVEQRWEKKKSGERRAWWRVLAGTARGKSRKVHGVVFPVLQAAQRRMGQVLTPNAICRNKVELAPPIKAQERWKKKRDAPAR